MENITVTIDSEKLQAAIKKQLEDACSSSYDSPIRKVITNALSQQEGAIKVVIDEIIANAISNPEFKDQMSKVVIQKLVETALKR